MSHIACSRESHSQLEYYVNMREKHEAFTDWMFTPANPFGRQSTSSIHIFYHSEFLNNSDWGGKNNVMLYRNKNKTQYIQFETLGYETWLLFKSALTHTHRHSSVRYKWSQWHSNQRRIWNVHKVRYAWLGMGAWFLFSTCCFSFLLILFVFFFFFFCNFDSKWKKSSWKFALYSQHACSYVFCCSFLVLLLLLLLPNVLVVAGGHYTNLDIDCADVGRRQCWTMRFAGNLNKYNIIRIMPTHNNWILSADAELRFILKCFSMPRRMSGTTTTNDKEKKNNKPFQIYYIFGIANTI